MRSCSVTDPSEALISRPTQEQIDAFKKLDAEQRFNWLMDMLALCYDLTPPELRERWRTIKAQR